MKGYVNLTTKDYSTLTSKINSSLFVKESITHEQLFTNQIHNTIFVKLDQFKIILIVTYLRPGEHELNETILVDTHIKIRQLEQTHPECKVVLCGDTNQESELELLYLQNILSEAAEHSPSHRTANREERNHLQKIYSNTPIKTRTIEELFKLSDHAGIEITFEEEKFRFPVIRTSIPSKKVSQQIARDISKGVTWPKIYKRYFSRGNPTIRVRTDLNRFKSQNLERLLNDLALDLELEEIQRENEKRFANFTKAIGANLFSKENKKG